MLLESHSLLTKKEFSPDHLANQTIWVDPSDATTIATSGSEVTAIADKFGNLPDGVPRSASHRPNYGSTTKNGLNTLDFSSDSIYWNNNARFDYSGGISVFLLSKVTTINGNNMILSSQRDPGGGYGFMVSDMLVSSSVSNHRVGMTGIFAYGTNDLAFPYQNGTEWVLNSFKIAASTKLGSFYKNGVFQDDHTFQSLSDNTLTPVLELGSRFQYSQFFTGEMGEVIIYNDALSDDDFAKVNEFLKNKWNI